MKINDKLINRADYVTENGANGEWNYRKWSSGKIEMWCYHQFEGLSITNGSSGTYYLSSMPTLSVPEVSSIDYVFGSATSALSSGTFIHAIKVKSNKVLEFDIRRWVSGTNINCGAFIYLIGKI